MVHVRLQIRNLAVAAATGLTTTGANVFKARVSPIRQDEQPCWNVLLQDETSDWDAVPSIERTGRLIFVGMRFGGADSLEELLDDMAAELEAAVYNDTSLTAVLSNFGPPTTQISISDGEGQASMRQGEIRLLIPVMYRSAISDPETLI